MISISWTKMRSCASPKKLLHNLVGNIAQKVWITVHLDLHVNNICSTTSTIVFHLSTVSPDFPLMIVGVPGRWIPCFETFVQWNCLFWNTVPIHGWWWRGTNSPSFISRALPWIQCKLGKQYLWTKVPVWCSYLLTNSSGWFKKMCSHSSSGWITCLDSS